MESVVLIAANNEEILVPKNIAEYSTTIKNVLDDLGQNLQEPVNLPAVSLPILKKVIEYLEHHDEHPDENESLEQMSEDEKRDAEILPWDQQFLGIIVEELVHLILAANYLDIQPLLYVVCKSMARTYIRGKSIGEIRQTFHITKEFTAEEEEQVKKENEWLRD